LKSLSDSRLNQKSLSLPNVTLIHSCEEDLYIYIRISLLVTERAWISASCGCMSGERGQESGADKLLGATGASLRFLQKKLY
jgi:hypothetical protein